MPSFQWYHLPPEIRCMILDCMVEPAPSGRGLADGNRTYNHSKYAATCREFQGFFESLNFARLVLGNGDLGSFQAIVTRWRRPYVRYIWLRAELRPYSCRDCLRLEKPDGKGANDALFTDVLHNLFSVLCTWKATGRHAARGITLELSAHSPSDNAHWSKTHRFSDTAHECRAPGPAVERFHDPKHQWFAGQQMTYSPALATAYMRTIGEPLALDYRDFACAASVPPARRRLPQVDAVATFVIRRQFCRAYDHDLLAHVLHALPRLAHLRYEMWQDVFPARRARHDAGYACLFPEVPATVRRLALFEDHMEPLQRMFHYHHKTEAAVALYRACLGLPGLEELAASYIIDAADFFGGRLGHKIPRGGSFPQLRELALTSSLLHPACATEHLSDLLLEAARAAVSMPNLRTMELWNSGPGFGCVIRLEVAGQEARFGVFATWGLALEQRVVEFWSHSLAKLYGCREIKWSVETLEAADFKSHASAIRYLKLRPLVIDKSSHYQLRCEETDYKVAIPEL